jgi:hypothetical protein
VTLFLASRCLRHALRLVVDAEEHTPFTKFDGELPLRGRWLRYAAAMFLALLGSAVLLLLACVLLGVPAAVGRRLVLRSGGWKTGGAVKMIRLALMLGGTAAAALAQAQALQAAMRAAAEGWDGQEPIRPMASLTRPA